MNNRAPLAQKLFSYARYNVELSEKGLQKLGLHGIEPKAVQPLDSVDHLKDLEMIGKAASACVEIEDFEGFLDPSTMRIMSSRGPI